MNIRLAFLFPVIIASSALADDGIARAQQELKDQGFYYGEITGDKNADTSAAVRRFQIRSGLQITGELNDETLKALAAGEASAGNKPVAAAQPSPPSHAISPAPQPDNSDLRDNSDRTAQEETEGSPQDTSPEPPRPGQPAAPVYPSRVAVPNGNFVRTPYQNSPPQVQQDVISRAERKLAKKDLYRGAIDGIFTSDLEFSLRAYQSRVGLPVTGRLDLQTLAGLELLPGANQPVFVPRQPYPQTPVRGEWVRP